MRPARPANAVRAVRQSRHGAVLTWRTWIAVIIVFSLLAPVLLGEAVLIPIVVYAALGLLSFVLYARDKADAIAGRLRVPEAWLHGLDFVGGTAGGLLAQDRFRHKVSKSGFAALTLVIALAHLVLLGAIAMGWLHWETLLGDPVQRTLV